MSRTLFWYILKDLLRIFLLTAAGLAAIMSFGGLLRPLTEHGLNAAQVGTMLACFIPAMTTYSFPVAALFATSMVYGRLSADNELTACRSSGISYLSMTMPALVLGLLVALLSLVCLCFVVPVFTLRVERVIYSNLAQLVQNEIEKTHQIKMDDFSVSAQSARVLGPLKDEPDVQRVELVGPMIVSYTTPPQEAELGRRMRTPTQFWTARTAVAFIEQKPDEVQLEVVLDQGAKFPRHLSDGPHMTVGTTQFGPVPYPSPIKEDPKFMNIQELKAMYQSPEESAKLRDLVKDLIKQEQENYYLQQVVLGSVAGPSRSVTFREDNYLRLSVLKALAKHGSFTFASDDADSLVDVRQLTVAMGGDMPFFPDQGGELVLRSGPKLVSKKVRIQAERPDGQMLDWEGRELHIHAEPALPARQANGKYGPPRIALSLVGYDVVSSMASAEASADSSAVAPADREPSFNVSMMVPMPREMWAPAEGTGEDLAEIDLTLTQGDEEAIIPKKGGELVFRSSEGHDARQVKLVLQRNGQVDSTWEAKEMIVKAEPQPAPRNATDQSTLLRISVDGYDVLIQAPEDLGPETSPMPSAEPTPGEENPVAASPEEVELAQHKKFHTEILIPLSDSLKQMDEMTVHDFRRDRNLSENQRKALGMATDRLTAKLLSEIHGRASFAISCLALVLVGCALGMMFRSGNFLSAFAVSFVPALLSIALIVTGQQVCARVNHGMGLGLGFIWGGNGAVMLLAIVLLGKLQRQ